MIGPAPSRDRPLSPKNSATDPTVTIPAPGDVLAAAREHLEAAMDKIDVYMTSEPSPGVANLRFAQEYEASAGVLRRRAARPDRSPEQVAEELRRADWLEKRAKVFRADGRMPAELRTPSETHALVDEVRQGMLGVANGLAELSLVDVVAFTGLLVDEDHRKGPAASAEVATAALRAFAEHLSVILALLGGRQQTATDPITMLPYEMPAFEVGQVVVGEQPGAR